MVRVKNWSVYHCRTLISMLGPVANGGPSRLMEALKVFQFCIVIVPTALEG
jgi:hypothetical protein